MDFGFPDGMAAGFASATARFAAATPHHLADRIARRIAKNPPGARSCDLPAPAN